MIKVYSTIINSLRTEQIITAQAAAYQSITRRHAGGAAENGLS